MHINMLVFFNALFISVTKIPNSPKATSRSPYMNMCYNMCKQTNTHQPTYILLSNASKLMYKKQH